MPGEACCCAIRVALPVLVSNTTLCFSSLYAFNGLPLNRVSITNVPPHVPHKSSSAKTVHAFSSNALNILCDSVMHPKN